MRAVGKDRTDIFSASGKLVARDISGVTYDGRGKLVYRGNLGLVVLGSQLVK